VTEQVIKHEIEVGVEKKIVSSIEKDAAEGVEKELAKIGEGAEGHGLNPCGCFLEGTLILTDSGYKKIEDIKIDDVVWAYNDTTGVLGRKKVIRVYTHIRDTVYQIYIGSEVINTTSDHPFFIGGRWARVQNLHVGDSVTTYIGKKLVIDKIRIVAKKN